MKLQSNKKSSALEQALDELDLISDNEAEILLHGLIPILPDEAELFMPQMPSAKITGLRSCNLVLVAYPEAGSTISFDEIAVKIRAVDPKINIVVAVDRPGQNLVLPPDPTLIVAPAMIKHLTHLPGRILCGMPLKKSQEYERLDKMGIPIPRWAILTQYKKPDLSLFSDYVVCKPNLGGQGAEVKLVRKNRIRWKPIVTHALGSSPELIVQKFIETGPKAVVYRVTTLFGQVLESHRFEGGCGMLSPTGKPHGGSSIVASAKNTLITLNYDEQVIRLGEQTHQAFPEIPVLGADIVRDIRTGNLYVLEVNAIGYVWHFTSPTGQGIETQTSMPLKKQFDALTKSAYILAEATQLWAE